MNSWSIIDKKLTKEFLFNDPGEVLIFVNALANLAIAYDQRPEIFVYSYNKVKIILFTKSVKSVTVKDYVLAFAIDRINRAA